LFAEPDPDLSRKTSPIFCPVRFWAFGAANIAKPGGDAIDARVDTHLLAPNLGAQIGVAQEYRMSGARTRGANMFLDEASVTATETPSGPPSRQGETVTTTPPRAARSGLCMSQLSRAVRHDPRFAALILQRTREFHIPSDHIELASYIGLPRHAQDL